MSEANLRSMPLADRGSRGNEVPLASSRFRVSGIVSRRLTKDLLALRSVCKKVLGLFEVKIGRQGALFLRNLSQLRLQMLRNFPDSTLVSDKGKFKPKV